jgi:hypothetical protein
MKHQLVVVLTLLSFGTLLAQENLGVKTVISAGATQTENLGHSITTPVNGVNQTVTINSVHIQAGLPYMGVIDVPFANNPIQNYIKDLGFPWDIRYRYNTFSEDAFTVSKGYFSDHIELNWIIKANQDKITSISVYRTLDISSDFPNWGNPIRTLAPDAGTFTDTNVEGGKLYRYKLAAKGVEADGIEIPYSTFITGIGYRNPTGAITGSINYSGGTPVKNVLVTANPTGAQLNFGSALEIQKKSYLLVSKLHENLKDSITFQAWVKPKNDLNNISLKLLKLYSDHSDSLIAKIILNNSKLSVDIGEYNLTFTNYIPSGEVNNKGEDILVPITEMNSRYTHFSIVIRDNQIPELYINGRLLSAVYAEELNALLSQDINMAGQSVAFTSNNMPINLNTSTIGNLHAWSYFSVGGGNDAYFDELRVWSTALTSGSILTDYRRYIAGNEAYLHTYIRANEGIGDYAYDLAHTGYNFHGNDARLSNAPIPAVWANDVANVPTSSQLGILGVTDENGNYVISSVPYSGNGESFTVVPSLGKHQFNPSQELAYIGSGSVVVNNLDFKDESSFIFRGNVVYDSRGVFPATSDAPITGDIKEDEFYNAYTVGNLKYQKGEYWAEKDDQGNITQLVRYAKIPVPKANVFIDGIQVLDPYNVPVQTDINGQFTIEVPIGKHAISVSKPSHEFEFDGRYPAIESTVINGETYITNTVVDFFQDSDEPVTFIDNTKVIVAGRVVGGLIEADKTIGFGFDGTKSYSYTDQNGIDREEIYTSKNNIGTAQLTLGYIPAGSTSITPEYQTSFSTNSETGEFRVRLLPLTYILPKDNLAFLSGINPDSEPLLDADMVINFTTIKPLTYPSVSINGETIEGEYPYQEILKFSHLASPISFVTSQTSETSVQAEGETYTISSDQSPLIYKQLHDYSIAIKNIEVYRNYDNSISNPIIDSVAVSGGTLLVTNNLAMEGTGRITTLTSDPSTIVYTFKGGFPNIDSGTNYERTIDLKIRANNIDHDVQGYDPRGIVLGGISDGTQTFVTEGPERADIILRDPPGSSSKATIEKGSVYSFTENSTISDTYKSENKTELFLGGKIQLGGGIVGPVQATETQDTNYAAMSFEKSSATGKEVESTYTFNESISTSDEPEWVGSDADLYIGRSANQYYGTYDDLTVTDSIKYLNLSALIKGIDSLGNTKNLYPKLQKAIYFTESPEKTFFIYSQKAILEEIIPRYEEIVSQIESGEIQESVGQIKSKDFYATSAKLWRQIIMNNEQIKYEALTNSSALKSSINIDLESLPAGTAKDDLKGMIDDTFFQNISFDSGTGEFTQNVEVEKILSSSYSYDFVVEPEFAQLIGFQYNENGFEVETKNSNATAIGNDGDASRNNSSNISYTLADYDEYNSYSIDVVNAFDGNGPIFVTRGGQTSCPYEPAEKSHYYNPTHSNVTNPNSEIAELGLLERIDLSYATAALEKPELTVEVASVTNIPDGRNAEFVLTLSNTSAIENEALFNLKVDLSTNPYNAILNIDDGGEQFLIKTGEAVEYTLTLAKGKEDQFDYENIRIYLESACGNADRNLSLIGIGNSLKGEVFLSASFVPACSPIRISAPEDNWLMNRNTAFNANTTTPLIITMDEYDTSFASFKQINLEYRLKGTPNWVGLKTYFKNQVDYDAALAGGDTNIDLIDGPELNYAWDIAGLGIANGSYELRAFTTCYNGTGFESDIIEGTVDLTAPVLFGTPTPKTGILGNGDDITLRFNEPVKTNGTVTKFEFLVQENQLPVAHEVSLAFNGASNTASMAKPAISNGDFSIEFWLKNESGSGSATLFYQDAGLSITLVGSALTYSLGGESITATIASDGSFNHYALSYDDSNKVLTIIENDKILKQASTAKTLQYTNSNTLVIGGNTFKGNVHDLRFWKRFISREEAVANMNSVLNGNESGLLGYWPMNEGNGDIAIDIVRSKNLVIANANWDIFPKGTAYSFDGTSYLDFDQMANVIISKEMDATVSFWMKTNQTGAATLISNGKGDGTDATGSNGYSDKWAISLNGNTLELQSEGNTYPFGNVAVNDDSWHHIAFSLTRNATVRMYVDGDEVGSYTSEAIGGFAAGHLYVGARGQFQADGTTLNIDNYYDGLVDELRIWNMARSAGQIEADRYYEVDFERTGLLFYAPFNKPELANSNGPKYYYPFNYFEQTSGYALSNTGIISFSDVTPNLKPFRPTQSLIINPVISGQDILLIPEISDWASIEGKIANITVSGLNDLADNRQESPVTWSVYINKNPIKWFVDGYEDVVSLIKRTNENLTFDITLINQGGENESYSISVPQWLTVTAKSGTLAPNATVTLKATVNNNIAVGDYNTILSLATNFGYNEQIHLDVRVLENEPDFSFDPASFTESMTIIGKVKLNGKFTDDPYDKVVAYVDGEVRGIAPILFDEDLNEYYILLSVYSNSVSGDTVVFYIWDASDGKLKEAVLDDQLSVSFLADDIIGTYTSPSIFSNTDVMSQQLALNQGWTWVSFNVDDVLFNDLNALTKDLVLGTSDLIQSNGPALFDAYQYDPVNSANNGWSGTISANGGISSNKMYKINLANAQLLSIKGVPVDLNTWTFDLAQNWNWLPYVATKNAPIGEALANLDVTDGDFIKSQSLFASYSASLGWKGSLTYLKAGEGYMLKVNTPQSFTYPVYLDQSASKSIFSKTSNGNQGELTELPYAFTQFSNTMSAIVKLPDGYNTVSFYNEGGQLRGRAATQDINGEPLAFVTLYGNAPEILTAQIAMGNNTSRATSKSIGFLGDTILGSLSNPFVIDLLDADLAISPNPFNSEFEIAINSEKNEIAKLVIINMLSQVVYSDDLDLFVGDNVINISPNLASGTYILRMSTQDNLYVKKIIKN